MANSGFVSTAPDLALIQGAGFATATDSLKIMSDVLDLIEGAGFATATDALHFLRAQIDLMEGAGFATGTDALHFQRLQIDAIEGAGFATATDSLKILSDILDLITGAGFATATDSLKILSDVLDLIEGAGFATATDSLKVLSDNIDAIILAIAAIPSPLANPTLKTSAGIFKEDKAFGQGLQDTLNLTSGAGADTFSAWTEYIADSGAAKYLQTVIFGSQTGNILGVFEIGFGAGGAEVPKIRKSYSDPAGTGSGCVSLNIIPLLLIPANTRIAIRLSCHVASKHVYFSLGYWDGVN